MNPINTKNRIKNLNIKKHAIIVLVLLSIALPVLNAHEILLKSGEIITVKSYWEQGDEIIYQKFGVNVYLKKTDIEKIFNDTENKPARKKLTARKKVTVPIKKENETADPFFEEVYANALEMYQQEKYENAVGLLSLCIDSGHNLTQSYLYRGAALFELAQRLETEDENRLEMGAYAKSDLDKAISMGENTGLAYISRAKVKWFLLSDSESSVRKDLDAVIEEGSPLTGMAYYWKGKHAQAFLTPFQANKFMHKSADLGHKEATRILFDNPLWPIKNSDSAKD